MESNSRGKHCTTSVLRGEMFECMDGVCNRIQVILLCDHWLLSHLIVFCCNSVHKTGPGDKRPMSLN